MPQHQKATVIITGASSGIGLYATKALVDRGWRVVMACRDLAKVEAAAATLNIPQESVVLDRIDLGSQASVRDFATRFKAGGLPLHVLVCTGAGATATAMARNRSHRPCRPRQPIRRAPAGFELSAAMVAVQTPS